MAHDVFVSYATPDKATALAVVAGLEARKIRCWIAPRDVPAGSQYAEQIVAAIKSCRVVVLVFSADANNSPHVQREVERAVSTGKIIIPLRVQDVKPTGAMEYCLGNTHWLDALTPPLEEHIGTLASTIQRILESPSTPGPSRDYSIPPGDEARLILRNTIFEPLADRYRSSQGADKDEVLNEAIQQFRGLRSKWKMPERVFRFYMMICLEEGRVIHLHEFIDRQRMVEFVMRHREFGNEVGMWLLAIAAGTDITNT